jgi:transposase-like protein
VKRYVSVTLPPFLRVDIHVEWNPEIKPVIIMTDHDQAQINTIKAIYLDSTIYLCWWHVLRAMWTHFHTEEFPKLWEHVREWVKTPDRSKFESWWDKMQNDPLAPQSFIDYLKVNWMTIVPMWSGLVRKNRMIFQEGDTKMLIES